MAIAAEFKVGDPAESPAGFRGRVIKIERGTVHVEYADKGGRSVAVYTPEWLARWPTMLRKPWVKPDAARRPR